MCTCAVALQCVAFAVLPSIIGTGTFVAAFSWRLFGFIWMKVFATFGFSVTQALIGSVGLDAVGAYCKQRRSREFCKDACAYHVHRFDFEN